MSAIAGIAAERARQISAEGWSPQHDDAHDKGEMIGAAACYLMHNLSIGAPSLSDAVKRMVRDLWPWAVHWWKPHGRRRDLIRAGALIVAEIERMDRAQSADIQKEVTAK